VTEREHLLAAYEHGLKKLADELMAEHDPSDEEMVHLILVSQLVQNLVHTYDEFQVSRAPGLEASMSVMYATEGHQERRVLNVPLRSLVDSSTMTPWHARYMNASMGTKRTIIVTGEENVGKSTLVNALIDLLPRDARIVFIDETEDSLPALRGRAFTVQLKAKQGTPQRASTFRKAIDMQPNWLVVGELSRRDGPSFFEALASGPSGLATVRSSDPEAVMSNWLSMSKDIATYLSKADVILVHMIRDQGGRPRLDQVLVVDVEDGQVELIPQRPS